MPPETETRGRWEGAAQRQPEKAGLPNKSDGDKPDGTPAYYDISLLKPPVWTPEVGVYFFLGGLSSGAFSLARLADRLGRGKYRTLTQAATVIAALAALPCAPLLIADLGDRKRFHHMLRIWKPSSPMNLGSWTLTAYTALGGIAALRELLRTLRRDAPLSGIGKIADETAGVIVDAGGIPLGVLLAGYTGILLSTTATPVWSRNPWIGPLFSAGAISAGAGAVHLALEGMGEDGIGTEALTKLETAARMAEAVCHAGFLAHAGPLAKPLTQGGQQTRYLAGAIGAGVILPEVLSRLPVPKEHRRAVSMVAGIIGLIGGYFLRASFVAAGRPSAEDPDAARRATGTKGSPA